MPHYRLRAEQVIAARKRVKKGGSRKALAAEYGVGENTLRDAVYGKTWRRLDRVEPPAVPTGKSGQNNGRATLNERQVCHARRIVRGGVSCRALARQWGIAVTTLRNAVCGHSWAHLNAREAPVRRC